jgi:hypothetical protein
MAGMNVRMKCPPGFIPVTPAALLGAENKGPSGKQGRIAGERQVGGIVPAALELRRFGSKMGGDAI